MADRSSRGALDTPAAVDWPAEDGVAVTPHDTTELANVCRALWVGGAGNVAVLTARGSTVVLSGVAAGTLIPIRCRRVNATNTTATLIVALD